MGNRDDLPCIRKKVCEEPKKRSLEEIDGMAVPGGDVKTVKPNKKRRMESDPETFVTDDLITPPLTTSLLDTCGYQDIQDLQDINSDSAVSTSHQGDSDHEHGLSLHELLSDRDRFRPDQSVKWCERYLELVQFQAEHGHCLVNLNDDPLLAKWIKTQRYQYKLMLDGRHSSLTDERIASLNRIGFIWDSHQASWEEHFADLEKYKEKNGHCLVPSKFKANPQLAIWVKSQRRQFKYFKSGRSKLKITADRIERLNALGFVWRLRNRHKM